MGVIKVWTIVPVWDFYPLIPLFKSPCRRRMTFSLDIVRSTQSLVAGQPLCETEDSKFHPLIFIYDCLWTVRVTIPSQ